MWTTPENFRAKIGGNYYINTPNIIVARGENLFRLKRRDTDGLLAVDFDVYDVNRNKVATVRNGNIVKGHSGNFEFHKEQDRYWVVEKKSGRVICDIRKGSKAEDGSEIEVSVDLYTKSGIHVVAGPNATNLGGMVMTGCTIQDCGAGIVVE
jgi:hypothetical protein